jgi:FixJ family two-component response regulator
MEQETIQAQAAGHAEIFSLLADLADDPMPAPVQQDVAGRIWMMAAPEIADELFLPVNTVKTHQRHLYQKLGARSRTQAVRQARAFGLLTSSSCRH